MISDGQNIDGCARRPKWLWVPLLLWLTPALAQTPPLASDAPNPFTPLARPQLPDDTPPPATKPAIAAEEKPATVAVADTAPPKNKPGLVQFQREMKSHPRIAQAQQNVCAAEYRRRQNRAGYFPTLNINFTSANKLVDETTRSDALGGVNSPEYDGEGLNVEMSLRQTLFDWGLTSASVRSAAHERTRAWLDLIQAGETVSLEALNEALTYHTQTQILADLRATLRLINRQVKALEARFKLGASRLADLREGQVLRIEAETNVTVAERRIEQAVYALETNFSLTVPQALDLAAEFTRLRVAVPAIITPAQSISGRSLVAQRAGIKAEDARLRAQGLPGLQAVVVGRGWDIRQDEKCTANYNRADPKCRTKEITANVEMAVPLYDGGRRRAERRATRAQLLAVDAEISAHKREHTTESQRLRKELLSLNVQLKNARQQLDDLKEKQASVKRVQARTGADPLALIRLYAETSEARVKLFSLVGASEAVRAEALALASGLATTLGLNVGVGGC